jgi:hypothetical protein
MADIAIENDHLYWIFPLKMVIIHSYVKLPEGTVLVSLGFPEKKRHTNNNSCHTKKYSIASTSPYLPYHMLIHSSSTDSNPLFS